MVAGRQHVRRTRSLIVRGEEEYLLASVQLRVLGRVEQDGRVALLSAGDMAFVVQPPPTSVPRAISAVTSPSSTSTLCTPGPDSFVEVQTSLIADPRPDGTAVMRCGRPTVTTCPVWTGIRFWRRGSWPRSTSTAAVVVRTP